MGKVYNALRRAEQEQRANKPHEISVTDKLEAAAAAASFHRPTDPVSRREYEQLASEIRHLQSRDSLKTLMVVSCQHSEGATTIAANLAYTLAEGGRLPILLVDANFRRPALQQIFHLSRAEGLTELISKEATWEATITETSTLNLFILAAGRPPANPAQLIELPRFVDVLEEFRSEFGLTIFDAPPLLSYADALLIAPKVDRVVLVAQAERTRRPLLSRSREELEKIGANLLGVVVNRKRTYGPRWLQRFLELWALPGMPIGQG